MFFFQDGDLLRCSYWHCSANLEFGASLSVLPVAAMGGMAGLVAALENVYPAPFCFGDVVPAVGKLLLVFQTHICGALISQNLDQ